MVICFYVHEIAMYHIKNVLTYAFNENEALENRATYLDPSLKLFNRFDY
jgi:hypothetical protein